MANKPVLINDKDKIFMAMTTAVSKWGKMVFEDGEIRERYKASYFDNKPAERLNILIERSINDPVTFVRQLNAELERFNGWKRSLAKEKGEYYDAVAKQKQPDPEEALFSGTRPNKSQKRVPWDKA